MNEGEIGARVSGKVVYIPRTERPIAVINNLDERSIRRSIFDALTIVRASFVDSSRNRLPHLTFQLMACPVRVGIAIGNHLVKGLEKVGATFLNAARRFLTDSLRAILRGARF